MNRDGTLILTSGLAVYQGYRVPLVDESTSLHDVVATQRRAGALEERALGAAVRGVRSAVAWSSLMWIAAGRA